MYKYKVHGDKLHHYYTVVTASSEEEAWDMAANGSDLSWFEIESDVTIEPYAVDPVDDEDKIETNQLEDGWPLMDNPIITSNK